MDAVAKTSFVWISKKLFVNLAWCKSL